MATICMAKKKTFFLSAMQKEHRLVGGRRSAIHFSTIWPYPAEESAIRWLFNDENTNLVRDYQSEPFTDHLSERFAVISATKRRPSDRLRLVVLVDHRVEITRWIFQHVLYHVII